MTAPVDVLAELDRRIEIGELFGQEHDLPNLPGNAALREARAAVAELMRTTKPFASPSGFHIITITRDDETVRRLCAALARCGGAA